VYRPLQKSASDERANIRRRLKLIYNRSRAPKSGHGRTNRPHARSLNRSQRRAAAAAVARGAGASPGGDQATGGLRALLAGVLASERSFSEQPSEQVGQRKSDMRLPRSGLTNPPSRSPGPVQNPNAHAPARNGENQHTEPERTRTAAGPVDRLFARGPAYGSKRTERRCGPSAGAPASRWRRHRRRSAKFAILRCMGDTLRHHQPQNDFEKLAL